MIHSSSQSTAPTPAFTDNNEILRLLDENRQVLNRVTDDTVRVIERLSPVLGGIAPVPVPATKDVGPPEYSPPSCELAATIREQILSGRKVAEELETLLTRIRI